MKSRWRKWLVGIHRDFGYFFAGTVLVFCLSGIALNHKEDWDPSFIIERREIEARLPPNATGSTARRLRRFSPTAALMTFIGLTTTRRREN